MTDHQFAISVGLVELLVVRFSGDQFVVSGPGNRGCWFTADPAFEGEFVGVEIVGV